MTRVMVTGSAGFIGYHLCALLLAEGHEVTGFDAMTDYYDVTLKRDRHARLLQTPNFRAVEGRLEDFELLAKTAEEAAPEVIVHLAAQAGVRFSLEQPRTYVDTNLTGTFNVMEIAREHRVAHLLMASTSSVYGHREDLPLRETDRTDAPLTIYAATKKANEVMGHSYAHIWGIPTTMFRFFTVYGPWGRPDMALFKFTKGIIEGTPIDIYNNGEMYRDFTYVTDLVRGIRLLFDAVPPAPDARDGEPVPGTSGWAPVPGDTLSEVAPWRVVNIGNSTSVRLLDFIEAIEETIGREAIRNYMPMQTGDVPATHADASLLQHLTDYRPTTDVREGVRAFVEWYRDYYDVR